MCLKPRRLCGHPCAENCHFPSTCPVDEHHPCPKLIVSLLPGFGGPRLKLTPRLGQDVTCSCGHLKQRARCATSAAKPEGNRERFIKCTDMCVVAKRNTALADALGIEKKEPKIKEVEYDPVTLSFYAANVVSLRPLIFRRLAQADANAPRRGAPRSRRSSPSSSSATRLRFTSPS